ncbi:MAG: DUF1194 domain-containing protein [Planctomycetota bacterium]
MDSNKLVSTIAVTGLLAAAGAVFMIPNVSQVQSVKAMTNERVPLELVLLVDTSGSVDSGEYALQQQGYVDAFRDADVQERISDVGGIAVTYIEWSNSSFQAVRVPWTKLMTAEDCDAFADDINGLVRIQSGDTMMAPAIEFAAQQLTTNSYDSLKWVIDVSGDGKCENWYDTEHGGGDDDDDDDGGGSTGTPWSSVMSSLPAGDFQINGICITTKSDVIDFYNNVLPQGEGAFAMQVDSFTEFGTAIKAKLIAEIDHMPSIFD